MKRTRPAAAKRAAESSAPVCLGDDHGHETDDERHDRDDLVELELREVICVVTVASVLPVRIGAPHCGQLAALSLTWRPQSAQAIRLIYFLPRRCPAGPSSRDSLAVPLFVTEGNGLDLVHR